MKVIPVGRDGSLNRVRSERVPSGLGGRIQRGCTVESRCLHRRIILNAINTVKLITILREYSEKDDI